MNSAQPRPHCFPSSTLPAHSDLKVCPLVEGVLLAIAADAGMTPALKTRLVEVASGLSYRRIAELHGISVNTVKTEINAMLGSLGASCCHEIRDAWVAACARVQAGAGEGEIRKFLSLRFE